MEQRPTDPSGSDARSIRERYDQLSLDRWAVVHLSDSWAEIALRLSHLLPTLSAF